MYITFWSYRTCPKGIDPYPSIGGLDEEQLIDCLCPGVCSGSLRLAFRGHSTRLIPFDSSAALVKYRLEVPLTRSIVHKLLIPQSCIMQQNKIGIPCTSPGSSQVLPPAASKKQKGKLGGGGLKLKNRERLSRVCRCTIRLFDIHNAEEKQTSTLTSCFFSSRSLTRWIWFRSPSLERET